MACFISGQEVNIHKIETKMMKIIFETDNIQLDFVVQHIIIYWWQRMLFSSQTMKVYRSYYS